MPNINETTGRYTPRDLSGTYAEVVRPLERPVTGRSSQPQGMVEPGLKQRMDQNRYQAVHSASRNCTI